MSKRVKFFAILMLLAGAIAVTPGTAMAQHHGGHGGGGHHGGWHGGGGYRGGGWRGGGWGPSFGFGWGYPDYYGYGPDYYAPEPMCDWVRVRVQRNGHWVLRRTWRCW